MRRPIVCCLLLAMVLFSASVLTRSAPTAQETTPVKEVALNYVAPKARFSGISKTMLGHLEDEMRELGIHDAFLTSTETAHRFYLSAGWTDVLSGGSDVEMFGLTRVYPMAKTLY